MESSYESIHRREAHLKILGCPLENTALLEQLSRNICNQNVGLFGLACRVTRGYSLLSLDNKLHPSDSPCTLHCGMPVVRPWAHRNQYLAILYSDFFCANYFELSKCNVKQYLVASTWPRAWRGWSPVDSMTCRVLLTF